MCIVLHYDQVGAFLDFLKRQRDKAEMLKTVKAFNQHAALRTAWRLQAIILQRNIFNNTNL